MAILYASGKYYACRHCYKLAYTSQSESSNDRALRQAQKIRKLLGGTANMMVPFPLKPKGMRWKTYWRFYNEHNAFANVSLAGMMKRIEVMEKRIK